MKYLFITITSSNHRLESAGLNALGELCLDVGNREDGIESVTENWRYFQFSLVS